MCAASAGSSGSVGPVAQSRQEPLEAEADPLAEVPGGHVDQGERERGLVVHHERRGQERDAEQPRSGDAEPVPPREDRGDDAAGEAFDKCAKSITL